MVVLVDARSMGFLFGYTGPDIHGTGSHRWEAERERTGMHIAPSPCTVSRLKTNGLQASIVLRACLRL